ncbi:MAG: hypothetical protein KJ558_12825 [Gammaproteobacteria bacterium]|nr:hypothetical protein [Gammaproteobacteria bacterium]MBU1655684.1 hypothetical protein [Gammaproteobacteria bacterium]MBU1961172.1 hypothetical protein [Gammaproteobacteria bacterium]
MIVDQELANRFIAQYRDFLLHIHAAEIGEEAGTGLIKNLSAARNCYLAERQKYSDYLDNEPKYDPDIKAAIKSLDVADWAYLRDTEHFSLFVKSNGTLGLAVVGLTQPIKEIFGCEGLYLRTGIVQLGNHYTIDGIIADPVKLGEGYEHTYGKALKKLVQQGTFHEAPAGNAPAASPSPPP